MAYKLHLMRLPQQYFRYLSKTGLMRYKLGMIKAKKLGFVKLRRPLQKLISGGLPRREVTFYNLSSMRSVETVLKLLPPAKLTDLAPDFSGILAILAPYTSGTELCGQRFHDTKVRFKHVNSIPAKKRMVFGDQDSILDSCVLESVMMESLMQFEESEQCYMDETAMKQLFDDQSLAVTIEVNTDQ